MEKKFMRIGTEKVFIKSELNPRDGFNLLLGARHEFVYLADFYPWQRVNGTWTGALGHLLNDNYLHWRQCVCVSNSFNYF
jgi:hypothetical protein